DEALARCVAASPVPVISAVGHETDFTICDFVADLRAPTPSAAAELAVPDAAELRQQMEGVAEQLNARLTGLLANARARVELLASAGVLRSPRRYLEDRAMTVAFLEKRLMHAADSAAEQARRSFGTLTAKLEALNPLHVLARGYAAVFDGDQRPVTRAAELLAGQEISIRFADQTANATVNGVRESE
ncbi:MAG: exodeoxyribonuclease VII large subunit, partial [Clostridia bacterium]|nr:exodeoxyribonuclease VII large subunit [Clostridia bacterium]